MVSDLPDLVIFQAVVHIKIGLEALEIGPVGIERDVAPGVILEVVAGAESHPEVADSGVRGPGPLEVDR